MTEDADEAILVAARIVAENEMRKCVDPGDVGTEYRAKRIEFARSRDQTDADRRWAKFPYFLERSLPLPSNFAIFCLPFSSFSLLALPTVLRDPFVRSIRRHRPIFVESRSPPHQESWAQRLFSVSLLSFPS